MVAFDTIVAATLYYVAPVTLLCISFPAAVFELKNSEKIISMVVNNPLIFLLNCSLAFLLNLTVFLIIGKTSALTMNIAGISKDIIVIALSTVMFACRCCWMPEFLFYGLLLSAPSPHSPDCKSKHSCGFFFWTGRAPFDVSNNGARSVFFNRRVPGCAA
eukprot:EG_transcript_16744